MAKLGSCWCDIKLSKYSIHVVTLLFWRTYVSSQTRSNLKRCKYILVLTLLLADTEMEREGFHAWEIRRALYKHSFFYMHVGKWIPFVLKHTVSKLLIFFLWLDKQGKLIHPFLCASLPSSISILFRFTHFVLKALPDFRVLPTCMKSRIENLHTYNLLTERKK